MSKPIHQEVLFDASPTRIFDAFMDVRQHGEFTSLGPEDGGGAATISREVGGSFSCHRGRIVGINVELVPNQRIVQAWRVANWEEGIYSMIKLELKAEGSGTRLVLDQTGIPEDQRDLIERGWPIRYWEPLRKYLA